MGWEKLTGTELRAMRTMLNISVKECATYVGNNSERAWRRWENDIYAVPDNVDTKMYSLVKKHEKLVNKLYEEHLKRVQNRKEDDKIKYYNDYNDYVIEMGDADILNWRLYQSAVSIVFSKSIRVVLV